MGRVARREGGGERGVTLVELLVTLALFAFLVLGVLTVWTKTQEAYFVGSEAAEVQQNTRAAIDFMVRELRATGRDFTNCAFDYDATSSPFLDCSSAKVAACQTKLGGNYNASNGLPGGGRGCTNLFAIPAAEAQASAIRVRSDRNANGRIYGMGNAITTGSDPDSAQEDVRYFLTTASPPCPVPGMACIARQEGTTNPSVAMVAVDIEGFQLTYYPRPGFGPCAAVNGVVPYPCPPFPTLPLTQHQADNIGRIRLVVTAVQVTAGQTVRRTLTTDVVLPNRR